MSRPGYGALIWLLLISTAWLCLAGCTSVAKWYSSSAAQGSSPTERSAAADASAAQVEVDAGTAAARAARESPASGGLVNEDGETVLDGDAALKKAILLLPFLDLSKYGGPWDIYTELPLGLADSLAGHEFFRVIPTERALTLLDEDELEGRITKGRIIAVGRQLGADVVIVGEIENLTMNRMRATVPLGGYRSYQGVATVTVLLYNVIDGRARGEYRADTLTDSKRTGIVNPAAHVPLDREYIFLEEYEWGTEAFHETLVGQAVGQCLQDLVHGLTELIPPPPSLSVSEPKIIDIDGLRAYINVGLADGIRNGDKFGVWDNGRELTDPGTGVALGFALPRRVGVVQVAQVLTDHLSQAQIVQGEGEIETGYSVRAE